jgi:hypothetical protein
VLEGKAEKDYYDIDQLPDEEFRYWLFADAFGWTPNQVDNTSAKTADWMLAIHGLVKKTRGEGSND